jgi:hypothetical protein
LPDTPSGVEFLKRRYARAIECGDHRTATRLPAEINHLINGQAIAWASLGRVVKLDSRQPAGPAQIQRVYHDDILYDHDEILGPYL